MAFQLTSLDHGDEIVHDMGAFHGLDFLQVMQHYVYTKFI